MAPISREDQRRYADAHASAEPANIYDPDCPESGQYVKDKYKTASREARRHDPSDLEGGTDLVTRESDDANEF